MKKALSLLTALLLAIGVLAGCSTDGKSSSQAAPPSSSASDSDAADATEIGTGSTVFTFEVTDDENNISRWNVHTDETTVGKALLALELINGEDSEYGLMVTEVNGLTADYNTDKAYWAFYIDGEYASTGVDSTNIEAGKTYSFVYTKE